MPGTFSQVLLHIIFSTKHRQRWLTPDLTPRLYAYIGGIIRTDFGALLDAGGVEDHVHLYVRMRTEHGIAKLLRTIKSQSTQWIHATVPELAEFAWQEGYSVFSVSKSQEPAVKWYIQTQAEHHAGEDFKSELRQLLRAHGVEFDERYVFDSAPPPRWGGIGRDRFHGFRAAVGGLSPVATYLRPFGAVAPTSPFPRSRRFHFTCPFLPRQRGAGAPDAHGGYCANFLEPAVVLSVEARAIRRAGFGRSTGAAR